MQATQPNPAPSQPPKGHEDAVLNLMKYLFHEVLCVACEVPAARKYEIRPTFLYGWLQSDPAGYASLDKEEVIKASNSTEAAWEELHTAIDDGSCFERYRASWHMVTMSDRPALEHQIGSVTVNLVIRWKDGVVGNLQSHMPAELLLNVRDFSDGLVAALTTRNVEKLVDTVSSAGLDALHGQSLDLRGSTPEDPYEVMMGLIVRMLRGGKLDGQELRADLRPGVEVNMRTAQSLMRPVVPPELLKRILQEAKPTPPAKEGQVHGGWKLPGT